MEAAFITGGKSSSAQYTRIFSTRIDSPLVSVATALLGWVYKDAAPLSRDPDTSVHHTGALMRTRLQFLPSLPVIIMCVMMLCD